MQRVDAEAAAVRWELDGGIETERAVGVTEVRLIPMREMIVMMEMGEEQPSRPRRAHLLLVVTQL